MATASYNAQVQMNSGGGGYSVLAGVNSVSISLGRTLVDVSAMNGSDDFTKRLAALKDFPITISGFYNVSDTAYGHVKTAFTTPATTLGVKVFMDGTLGAGLAGFSVTCLVESIEISASVDGAQEISINLQSNSDVAFI
jgi:predicted secreted protein